LITAVVHTLFLLILAVPFVIIAAGPAGMVTSVIVASLVLLFLIALASRFAGMLISHVGEHRYVIRVIGGWIYLALLYIATVQILPVLNPIVALVRQYQSSSGVAERGGPLPATSDPLLHPVVAMVGLIVVIVAFYVAGLMNHKRKELRHHG
jgi:hypothetical protein